MNSDAMMVFILLILNNTGFICGMHKAQLQEIKRTHAELTAGEVAMPVKLLRALTEEALKQGHMKSFYKIQRELLVEEACKTLSNKLKYMLAEVAMYKADRFLDINMVPNVILSKKKNAENKEVVSCSMLWIEATTEKIAHSDVLKKLITEKEWAQMNIFYFLFGQYDRHFGNQVIAKDSGKLWLIDNEAVANINQMVLGYSEDKRISCPWVPMVKSEEAIIADEPEDVCAVLQKPQDSALMHKLFSNVDEWTKRDIDRGFCRVWHKILWRQMYVGSTNLEAPFSDVISPELLEKLKQLQADDIASFWPQLPCAADETVIKSYQDFITTFVQKTLVRRDMILGYFEKHPEGLRPYKN